MRLTLNGETREVDATTLADLVGPLPAGHAVAVNGQVVPRAAVTDRRLADGDVIDVVTAVAGG